MNAVIQQNLLQRIVTEWRSLTPDARPWGVWICLYGAMEPESDFLHRNNWPEAVWFLDSMGLQEHNIWTWQRFYTVQIERPWCLREFAEPNQVLGQRYKIGLAAFAPYRDSDDFYMEVMWGKLFGYGWRISGAVEGGPYTEQGLWIS